MKLLVVANYTIQVGAYYNKPKQWVVDGFDGKSWHNISTVKESGLNESGSTKTFRNDGIRAFFP